MNCNELSPYHAPLPDGTRRGFCILPKGHSGLHQCECRRYGWSEAESGDNQIG
jgi:hypothetical protein